MALPSSLDFIAFLIAFLDCSCDGRGKAPHPYSEVPKRDVNLLEFPLILEYLEAEFFLYGSTGNGLDRFSPNLIMGGPPPYGARQATLDPIIRDIVLQFTLQEVGHLRAIQSTVRGFPRPFLNLIVGAFAAIMAPFDPYANSLNYLLVSFVIPYVSLKGYVGANPKLQGTYSKRLVAGLLGVESGEDAVIRALLYERADMPVDPYGVTVSDFTDCISVLRNKLGHCGWKDKGLVVPWEQGAEGSSHGEHISRG